MAPMKFAGFHPFAVHTAQDSARATGSMLFPSIDLRSTGHAWVFGYLPIPWRSASMSGGGGEASRVFLRDRFTPPEGSMF